MIIMNNEKIYALYVRTDDTNSSYMKYQLCVTFSSKIHKDFSAPIDIYLDFDHSGNSTQRPGFSQLVQDIKDEKICTVVVADIQRITEDTEFLKEFKTFCSKYKVNIIDVSQSPDTTNFRAEIAEMLSLDDQAE